MSSLENWYSNMGCTLRLEGDVSKRHIDLTAPRQAPSAHQQNRSKGDMRGEGVGFFGPRWISRSLQAHHQSRPFSLMHRRGAGHRMRHPPLGISTLSFTRRIIVLREFVASSCSGYMVTPARLCNNRISPLERLLASVSPSNTTLENST